MSDDSKYRISFPGQFENSQFVVGEHNTVSQQNVGRAAREYLDPTEIQALLDQLGAVRHEVAAQAPGDLRDQAMAQIDELKTETVESDSPEPSRMARVYRWFLHNAPDLAETVSSLLLGPLVGKLVGGGAGAVAAALGADDTQEPST